MGMPPYEKITDYMEWQNPRIPHLEIAGPQFAKSVTCPRLSVVIRDDP